MKLRIADCGLRIGAGAVRVQLSQGYACRDLATAMVFPRRGLVGSFDSLMTAGKPVLRTPGLSTVRRSKDQARRQPEGLNPYVRLSSLTSVRRADSNGGLVVRIAGRSSDGVGCALNASALIRNPASLPSTAFCVLLPCSISGLPFIPHLASRITSEHGFSRSSAIRAPRPHTP